MAGHSKWANIKRKKEVVDKKRSSLFTKLSKAITMAVIEGGGAINPDFNVKLRLAIEKAKESNMPKDNIERAIQKGSGANKEQLKQVQYEAFGPSNSAIMIKVFTDNPNRSVAELRVLVERHNGKFASPGAVKYLFEQKRVEGVVKYIPYVHMTLESREVEESLVELLNLLEDHEDVDEVFTNVEFNYL